MKTLNHQYPTSSHDPQDMNAQDYRFQGDDSEEPNLKEYLNTVLNIKNHLFFAIKTFLQIVFYILLILILILWRKFVWKSQVPTQVPFPISEALSIRTLWLRAASLNGGELLQATSKTTIPAKCSSRTWKPSFPTSRTISKSWLGNRLLSSLLTTLWR